MRLTVWFRAFSLVFHSIGVQCFIYSKHLKHIYMETEKVTTVTITITIDMFKVEPGE